MKARARPTDAMLVAVGFSGALFACGSRQGASDAGPPQGASREVLLDPNTCKRCHQAHYDDWSHSVHAYASDDPVFVAMNKRGQRETSGALGDFCVKCHAPMAVVDEKTNDGLNLADLDPPYHGVTCFFCHTVDSVTGTHNAALSLSGDQRPKMRGEYSDPLANKVHDSTYSSFFDRNQPASSAICGTCHDIIVRDSNAFIERTFCEWAHSAFNAPHNKDGSSCVECHMVESSDKIAQVPNVVTREVHKHDWPGVDVPLNATDGVETAAVKSFLARTFQGALCVTAAGGIRVILDTVSTGHAWPSGSAQDRRAWAEVIAYSAGNIIFQSGVVPDGMSIVDTVNSDKNLWLLRDQMLDAQNQPVRMFWQAARTKGNEIPALPTFDKLDPSMAFYRTHIVQLYPRVGPGVPDFLQPAPDHVTLRLRLQPIGIDVLDDLVASGDLDTSVLASMPTYDVSFTMPDGSIQPSLEWLASASGSYTPIQDQHDNSMATCATTYMFDPSATTNIAPEPGSPADCADGGTEAVALGEDAGANADAAAQCDPRYASDNIVPGLTKQSDSGALTFVLVKVDHVPPVADYNSWLVKILDKNGQPVTDAKFTKITEYMPLHGHSSSTPAIVTNNGDGTYAMNRLDLFMPGVWWVTPYVQVGSTMDTVKFSFCAGG